MVWRGNSRTVSGRIEFSGLCCRRKAWGSEAGLDLALFFSSSLGKRRRRRRIEAVALYSRISMYHVQFGRGRSVVLLDAMNTLQSLTGGCSLKNR